MKELLKEDILTAKCTNPFQNGYDLQFGIDYGIYPSHVEFDKVMYLVYDGSLRQFKIKKVTVFPFNYGIGVRNKRTIYKNITTIDVAGVGELNVGLYMYGGKFDCKIYGSVEDYKAGKEYMMKYDNISLDNCERLFGIKFVSLNFLRNNVVHRWHWDGTSACLRRVTEDMPMCYILEKARCYFPEGWNQQELSGYSTKEECVDDNEISVVNFDEPKTFKVNVSELRSRKVEIQANTFDEAVEKAKKLLETDPLNGGDSNGVEFF